MFRVKKWKASDKNKKEFLAKDWRQKCLNDVEGHDYVLLTDSETFKKEDTEVLEGIYHLTKEGNAPYSHLTKVDLNFTSEEKQIKEEAFAEFTF